MWFALILHQEDNCQGSCFYEKKISVVFIQRKQSSSPWNRNVQNEVSFCLQHVSYSCTLCSRKVRREHFLPVEWALRSWDIPRRDHPECRKKSFPVSEQTVSPWPSSPGPEMVGSSLGAFLLVKAQSQTEPSSLE